MCSVTGNTALINKRLSINNFRDILHYRCRRISQSVSCASEVRLNRFQAATGVQQTGTQGCCFGNSAFASDRWFKMCVSKETDVKRSHARPQQHNDAALQVSYKTFISFNSMHNTQRQERALEENSSMQSARCCARSWRTWLAVDLSSLLDWITTNICFHKSTAEPSVCAFHKALTSHKLVDQEQNVSEHEISKITCPLKSFYNCIS